VFLVVTVIGASLLNNLVKFLVDRARPTVPVALSHPTGSSFPSGHAMASFVALGLVALLARWSTRRPAAIAVTAACAVGVLLVGFSRMALGAHYLSDVLGAWLLGLAWLVALVEIFGVARRRDGDPEISASRP
jgi:undecaprenyl-diphosphatase